MVIFNCFMVFKFLSIMYIDYFFVWDNCLLIICQYVNNQSFKIWFELICLVNLCDMVLMIQVFNCFFYEWLEEYYVGLLKMIICKELGDNVQLLYQIVNGSGECVVKVKCNVIVVVMV